MGWRGIVGDSFVLYCIAGGGADFSFHFSSPADIFKQFFGTDDPFADFLNDPFRDSFGEQMYFDHVIIMLWYEN